MDTCNRLGSKTDVTRKQDPYFDYFTVNPAIRCHMAVDVTLPSEYIRHDVKFMLAMSTISVCKRSVDGFCYLNFTSANKLLNKLMRRCVLCFIDCADDKHEL